MTRRAFVVIIINNSAFVAVGSVRASKAFLGLGLHLLWVVSALKARSWRDRLGWANVTLRTRSCNTVVLDAVVAWRAIDALINRHSSRRCSVLSFWTSDWQWGTTRAEMTGFAFILWIVGGGGTVIAPKTRATEALNNSLRAPLCIWTSWTTASIC